MISPGKNVRKPRGGVETRAARVADGRVVHEQEVGEGRPGVVVPLRPRHFGAAAGAAVEAQGPTRFLIYFSLRADKRSRKAEKL